MYRMAEQSKIPHTIHYFWFGGAEKPELVLKCIESWKKFMPDYEIIEWNESNYDIHKSAYTEQAYAAKKWAFVSDYARFDILYQYGGIYFDTDVELRKPIPAHILADSAFTGMESSGMVATGLVMAAEKGHPFLAEVVDDYNRSEFSEDCKYTVVYRVTDLLKKHGFQLNGEIQNAGGVTAYPYEYFCGFDTDVREYNITENTISVHHYMGSWVTNKGGFKMKLKKLIGVNNYRRILAIKRRLFGVHE